MPASMAVKKMCYNHLYFINCETRLNDSLTLNSYLKGGLMLRSEIIGNVTILIDRKTNLITQND